MVRGAVVVALAVVGFAVLAAERWTVDHELQIVAPDRVAPGDPIPLRAWLFGAISDPAGGMLVGGEIEVLLCEGDDHVLARTELLRAPTQTAEGSLPPQEREGRFRLRAIAGKDGEVLATVERPITITRDAPPLPLSGRLVGPLQQLRVLPPIVLVPDVLAPHLQVRVVGGTCIPEEPCTLLVTGPDVDLVTVAETPAATFVRTAFDAGLHRIVLVPHGPECEIELVLRNGSTDLARVPVRLPIALATPWFEAHAAGHAIHIEAHPPLGRDALILDVYDRGRWISTQTLDRGVREWAAPRPGLLRLQVRSDPFGAGNAAVRYVLVGDTPLARARELLEAEGVTLSDPPGTDPRLLLAGAEEELRTLPQAVSGLEADQARLRARRERLRSIGAVTLLVGMAVFVLTVLHRGLGAAAKARRLLAEAGAEDADTPSARRRMTWTVLAYVGAVAVALLAAAALVLVRSALKE